MPKPSNKPKGLEVQDFPLSDLKTWDKNARFISDDNFRKLCTILKRKPELLWKNPVYANNDGTIYSGNMRYRAALSLGWETIPAVVSPVEMTAKEMTEEAIILNHHHGEDKEDELAAQLQELDEAGVDVYVLGLEKTDVDQALDLMNMAKLEAETEEDEGDLTVPVKGVTKPGDMWKLGEHRLLCGDATKLDDVQRLCPEPVDMVFTDPPYNVDYEGGSGLKIMNDSMDDGAFLQFLRDAFVGMAAVTKEGGAIYVCHADSEGLNFRQAMKDAGWLLKQCIIWVKSSIVMGRQDYQWQHEPIAVAKKEAPKRVKNVVKKHEPILYGWKDGAAHEWYGGRDQSTVWEISKPTRSDEHPTMKPIELVAKAIKNSSERGAVVLDPFGGSGSTLIACEKIGRVARTMELDPKYCDVIVRRWEQFTGERAELLETNLLADAPEYSAKVSKKKK